MKISREELLATLESVHVATSRRPSFEQAHCLVFDQGSVLAFDGELCCLAPSPLDLTGAVPARSLMDYLRKLPEDELDVSRHNGCLRVKGRSRRVDFPAEDRILLPTSQIEQPADWKELPEDFAEAASLVCDCASDDDKQFDLACVHVTDGFLEAYDGSQMLRHDCPLASGEFLVAKKAVKQAEALGMTHFSLSERWAHFQSTSGFRLSALRYVNLDYYDLSGPLADGGQEVELPRALAEAAALAEIACAGEEQALLTVTLLEGEVRVVADGLSARYEERRKVKYAGPELVFGIAPKLLAAVADGHGRAQISPNRLLVDGGRWRYAVRLHLKGDA